MLEEILCNQRDLASLGHIGAMALSAFAYRKLQRRVRDEVPALPPRSKFDPIAFAWARCNPGTPFPKALKGGPSWLAVSLASAPHPASSWGVRNAA